jgi:hypothetical protein
VFNLDDNIIEKEKVKVFCYGTIVTAVTFKDLQRLVQTEEERKISYSPRVAKAAGKTILGMGPCWT